MITGAARHLNARLKITLRAVVGKQAQRSLLEKLDSLAGEAGAAASLSVESLPKAWPDRTESSAKRRQYSAAKDSVDRKAAKVAKLKVKLAKLRAISAITRPVVRALEPQTAADVAEAVTNVQSSLQELLKQKSGRGDSSKRKQRQTPQKGSSSQKK